MLYDYGQKSCGTLGGMQKGKKRDFLPSKNQFSIFITFLTKIYKCKVKWGTANLVITNEYKPSSLQFVFLLGYNKL